MKRTLFDFPYLSGDVCFTLFVVSVLLFGTKPIMFWFGAIIVDYVAKWLVPQGNIWKIKEGVGDGETF